jgi:hypothetical protein
MSGILACLNKAKVTRSQIVDSFRPNFAVPRFLWHRFATVRLLYLSLCLLFLVVFLAGGAAAADVPSAPASSLGPNLSFSIADFDGDAKPDLASVQTGKSDSVHTDYWVQLQFSGAERQAFQILAPVGGLQIVARDVNGDHALDLVLTTTWLRQPVAILLNDGHGTFSRVDPDAFPEAFHESNTSWSCATEHAIDVVGLPPQSREDICSEAELFLHLRLASRFAANSFSQFRVGLFLISHLGRAPPSGISHS